MIEQERTESAELDGLLESFGVEQRERIRALRTAPVNQAGQYVLYWLRTAMRAHENPALDVAINLANTLRLPLLVHQEFSSRFPHASDRHFVFLLEGARELSRELRKLDICYTAHVQRQGQRPSWLHHLAEQAAVVVTEEMPVRSMQAWLNELLCEIDAPVLAVDTACIVPMQLVGQAYDRAYQYRKATQKLCNTRINTAFPDMPRAKALGSLPALPFEPVDFEREDIEQIVAACDIDHTVGPVSDTTGGSLAGYHRWNEFTSRKLARYAEDRNDALLDATSRMSPYLHYGMVSPFRLAREAAAIGGRGAEKFLDEMLIWREMAYAFCFYRPDHESLDAIPQWAVETLRAGECDERQALLSWETLARGRTADRLWDAAQRSLLIHGELHNNLRMTWGKAFLNWTVDARDALAKMIDLNHRYALDGNDPSSYGGLLWCLGQFDREFEPPRPVFGTVRYRGTAEHARRLDIESYWQKAARPVSESLPRVAVIGAGTSGLMCARTLADHGVPVVVFEKSRGVGGRMATRRSDDGIAFDHGAQYFTVRDERFNRYVQSWQHDGIVDCWEGRIRRLRDGQVEVSSTDTQRFVGVPSMTAVCKHLAVDIDVTLGLEVAHLVSQEGLWQLADVDGSVHGPFDIVIVSAPSAQSARLLEPVSALAARAEQVRMQPCWAVMVAFDSTLAVRFDGAFVQNSSLSWVARNSSKPARSNIADCWVLHGSAEWSLNHAADSAEEVMESLLQEFWRVTGISQMNPTHIDARRWRYALPLEPLEDRCLFDSASGLGACGDWCSGPRVEGAFLSGAAAAGYVLRATVLGSKARVQETS